MLMTEEQARTKACPKALAPDVYSETIAVNREHGRVHDGCRCVATDCMAWRDAGQQRETIRNDHDQPAVERAERKPFDGAHQYDGGWRYSHTDTDRDGRKFDLLHRIASDDTPRLGYCGAFGKPEGM